MKKAVVLFALVFIVVVSLLPVSVFAEEGVVWGEYCGGSWRRSGGLVCSSVCGHTWAKVDPVRNWAVCYTNAQSRGSSSTNSNNSRSRRSSFVPHPIKTPPYVNDIYEVCKVANTVGNVAGLFAGDAFVVGGSIVELSGKLPDVCKGLRTGLTVLDALGEFSERQYEQEHATPAKTSFGRGSSPRFGSFCRLGVGDVPLGDGRVLSCRTCLNGTMWGIYNPQNNVLICP